MNLNLSKLSKEIENSTLSKLEIASRCKVDRKTIENVLSGRDPKLSTIVSLASVLNLKISYLFDEDKIEEKHITANGHHSQAAEKIGKVDNREYHYDKPYTPSKPGSLPKPTYEELEDEVSRLRNELLAVQSKLINLLTKSNSQTQSTISQ